MQETRRSLPAQEERHVEKRSEESEELKGEHLYGKAPLCGCKWANLFCKATQNAILDHYMHWKNKSMFRSAKSRRMIRIQ